MNPLHNLSLEEPLLWLVMLFYGALSILLLGSIVYRHFFSGLALAPRGTVMKHRHQGGQSS